jgi:hypothetical protein
MDPVVADRSHEVGDLSWTDGEACRTGRRRNRDELISAPFSPVPDELVGLGTICSIRNFTIGERPDAILRQSQFQSRQLGRRPDSADQEGFERLLFELEDLLIQKRSPSGKEIIFIEEDRLEIRGSLDAAHDLNAQQRVEIGGREGVGLRSGAGEGEAEEEKSQDSHS